MTYTAFLARVRAAGWSLSELRCDVDPPESLLDFIDEVSTAGGFSATRYERYVMRLANNWEGASQCHAN